MEMRHLRALGLHGQEALCRILWLSDIGQGIGRLLKTAGFRVIGFKRRINVGDTEKLQECADRVSNNLIDVLSVANYVVNIIVDDIIGHLKTSFAQYDCNARTLEFQDIGELVAVLDEGLFSKAVLDEGLFKGALSLPDEVADVFVKTLDLRLNEQPMLYEVDWANGY
ncbi:unnamed protein product [Peronospora belbahrii]|uniref:Uncharacterized protein n=1 Tax=Peronospora belbahrii TaxID=622444 RepID=A0AAU9L433_9STRA|nr:unnamed protein product [Peronospora belbahrii]